MRRLERFVKVGVAGLLLGSFVAVPLQASKADTLFPQTGFSMWGPFESYWKAHGGLAQFGLPRTSVFPSGKGYDEQFFERALFTYTPNNPDAYKVQLQLLGDTVTQKRTAETPFKQAQPLGGTTFFPQTSHNLSGKFLQYWQATGGLSVYGYPISEPFVETSKSDGKQYTVQYFERNRFEYHPELAGTKFEVQLGLLGSEVLDASGGPAAFASLGSPIYYPAPSSGGVVVPGGGLVQPGGTEVPASTPTPYPTAPALPTTQKAVLYSSDFSADLTGWQEAALLGSTGDVAPSWHVRDGVLQQDEDAQSEGGPQDAFLILGKPQQIADGTLDVYFRGTSGEPVGELLRYNSSDNSFYYLRLFGTGGSSAKAELWQVSQGARKVVATSTTWPGYTRNVWQRLEVAMHGANIAVSIDGTSVLSLNSASLLSGQVGLYANATGIATFDNFRVTAP